MPIYTKKITTPAGTMIIGADDRGICLFDFEYRKMMPGIKARIIKLLNKDFEEGSHPLHHMLEAQLDEYFNGLRKVFDLPLQFSGSPFQKKVWNSLLAIPYGETRSYKQQAIAFGDEKAIRAVASANGANCLAIIVPCHRVVGADNSLTGYAGGLQSKRWLLEHERRNSEIAYQHELF